MRFLSFVLIALLAFPCYAGNQWREGTGEDSILGTISPSDLDKDSFENVVDPLDRVLSNFRQGCRLEYASASTLTVTSGEVMVSNAGGSVRLMQQNTTNTTVSWSDIDTGSEANSTTYYVWAFQETTGDADFDVCMSTSSSAPSGKTYYKRLGSFVNDASGNITDIQNDGFFADLGAWESKSNNVVYQATTDGFCMGEALGAGAVYVYTDSSSSPTTIRNAGFGSVSDSMGAICPVKKGDYYKVYVTAGSSIGIYWISLE